MQTGRSAEIIRARPAISRFYLNKIHAYCVTIFAFKKSTFKTRNKYVTENLSVSSRNLSNFYSRFRSKSGFLYDGADHFARPKGNRLCFRRRHLERSGSGRHGFAVGFAPGNRIAPARIRPTGNIWLLSRTRTGNGDIYVLNLETNELSRITFDDSLDNLDAWSRDGKWLYFSSTSKDIAGMNDIFRVSANGGTPQQISSDRYTNEFFAAPAPDGVSFAFSARGISNSQWWRKGRSHIDESEIWLENRRKL